MMSERLRQMRPLLTAAPNRYAGTVADVCDAAADRIEALEAELAQMREAGLRELQRLGQEADAMDEDQH